MREMQRQGRRSEPILERDFAAPTSDFHVDAETQQAIELVIRRLKPREQPLIYAPPAGLLTTRVTRPSSTVARSGQALPPQSLPQKKGVVCMAGSLGASMSSGSITEVWPGSKALPGRKTQRKVSRSRTVIDRLMGTV